MKTFVVVLLMGMTFVGLGVAGPGSTASQNSASQGMLVSACSGQVDTTDASGRWTPVTPGTVLAEGSVLRTASNASADLLLQYNGSVFRLISASELRIEKLHRADTGIGMITDTHLKVIRGELIGSQRKLHKPSILQIDTPQGQAFIRGTEYVVNAQGAVSVLSGSVEVNYNQPGNQGSVKVTIPAGSSFNPATGTVVPTTAEFLQNIIADVDTVKRNAEVYKAGGATIVVKPEAGLSPTNPKGNNGVGNGLDPQPPGNPPINDGPGTGPGNPGNQGGSQK
jgi:hypothetical protein